MNITNDRHIKDFYRSRNLRGSTQDLYTTLLTHYCLYVGKTPTELIEEAEEEEEERIRMKNRKIKTYLLDYSEYLENNGKSPGYIDRIITTIRTFYSEYEIELPRKRKITQDKETLITKEDIVTKKHIKEALKHANTKYKAIILLMVSSGMGASEICNLTWKNFLTAVEMDKYKGFDVGELRELVSKKHYLIPTWYINRQKTSMPYFTFSSPESIDAIFTFLDERNHLKRNITSPEDTLFEFDGNKMNTKGMVAYFQRLNDRAGFGWQQNKRTRFFHSHVLRKFFASTLKEAGLPELEVNWMLGHRPAKISGIYIKPSVKVLKNQYRKLVPKLSLEKVNLRDMDSEEYDKLQKQLEETKKESEMREIEFKEMKRRVDALEKLQLNKEYHKDFAKE